jgi:hypothetical protein
MPIARKGTPVIQLLEELLERADRKSLKPFVERSLKALVDS